MAEITDENDQCYSYEPRSDFLFSVDRCPRINIEVCSDPRHERDCYRLLLQAGLLVRTMNMIKPEGSSFISIAIYVSNHHSADWYLVYQPDRADPKVGITNSSIADHWNSFLCRSSIPKMTSTLNYPLAGSNSFASSTISPLPFPSMTRIPPSKIISQD